MTLDRRELSKAFAAAQTTLEFDAYARTYAGHRTMEVDGHTIRLVPLRVGTKPIGLLAAAGRPIEPGTLDTLGGVVAIAIERAHFLEERKSAELTRQSEELKTALLASLGHDLRTPLTAIRVAASNIKASWMTADARVEQTDLILTEVERLTRLFQNILDMARIDAGAIAAETRWAHPSEIIAAARGQVEQTLQRHKLDVTRRSGCARAPRPAADRLRPGAPAGERGSVLAGGFDHQRERERERRRAGRPGARSRSWHRHADLPHLFDRFYRGAAATTHLSGTGMGLAIARGLLAVERGQIWAENGPDGGAQFTILVPATTREPEPSASPTA